MIEFPLVAEHHRVLDIPVNASPEQIKNQYKLLVRIYHPDRYQDEGTRNYAEQKLKRINHAYTALAKNSTALQTGPRPVAYNSQLDFGIMAEKTTKTLCFQVENRGGPVHDTRLTLSEENTWFYVKAGVPLFSGIPFPMEFTVAADTQQLTAGQSYAGWIDVQLDEATTRVAVALTVATPPPASILPVRYMLHIALLLLIFGVLFVRNSTAQQLNAVQLNTKVANVPLKINDLVVNIPNTIGTQRINLPQQKPFNPHPLPTALAIPVVEVIPTVSPLQQLMPTPTPAGEVEQANVTAVAPAESLFDLPSSVLITIPGDYNVYARRTPAATGAVVQLLSAGTQWSALGRSSDNRWLYIRLTDQQMVWVFREAVQIEADGLLSLPVVHG